MKFLLIKSKKSSKAPKIPNIIQTVTNTQEVWISMWIVQLNKKLTKIILNLLYVSRNLNQHIQLKNIYNPLSNWKKLKKKCHQLIFILLIVQLLEKGNSTEIVHSSPEEIHLLIQTRLIFNKNKTNLKSALSLMMEIFGRSVFLDKIMS